MRYKSMISCMMKIMKAVRRGAVKKTVRREEKRNLAIPSYKIKSRTEQAGQAFLFLLYCR